MPKISALPALSTALSPDFEIPMHNTTSGATEKITLGELTGYPDFGWVAAIGTWSYSSWSSTTRIGVLTVPTDATLIYQPGYRIKITQATGGTKYGIITAVSATTLTIFFPAGTTLNNEAITFPWYSNVDTPFGFPADPTYWTLLTQSASSFAQASPAASTWYTTGISLAVGIGVWDVTYLACLTAADSSGTPSGVRPRGTLSTANNTDSSSGANLVGYTISHAATSGWADSITITCERRLDTQVLGAGVTYYLNVASALASTDSIGLSSAAYSYIRAVCALL